MSIFCNKCNYKNINNAKFCQGCGGKLIATESDGTLTAGVILNNRYEIKGLLKTGGFGSVYEAIDQTGNSICAVKEMISTSSDTPEEREYLSVDLKEKKKFLVNCLTPIWLFQKILLSNIIAIILSWIILKVKNCI